MCSEAGGKSTRRSRGGACERHARTGVCTRSQLTVLLYVHGHTYGWWRAAPAAAIKVSALLMMLLQLLLLLRYCEAAALETQPAGGGVAACHTPQPGVKCPPLNPTPPLLCPHLHCHLLPAEGVQELVVVIQVLHRVETLGACTQLLGKRGQPGAGREERVVNK